MERGGEMFRFSEFFLKTNPPTAFLNLPSMIHILKILEHVWCFTALLLVLVEICARKAPIAPDGYGADHYDESGPRSDDR